MEILLKKALRLPPGVSEPRVIDLLWHTPTGVIDRRATPTVAAAVPGTIATLEVRVLKHKPAPRGNTARPTRWPARTTPARIDLVFFHAERKFIERQLPDGQPSASSAAASRATTTRSRWRIPTTSSRPRRAPICRCWSRSIR